MGGSEAKVIRNTIFDTGVSYINGIIPNWLSSELSSALYNPFIMDPPQGLLPHCFNPRWIGYTRLNRETCLTPCSGNHLTITFGKPAFGKIENMDYVG